MTNLIIFDVDGTLIDRDTAEYLPGVLDWFNNNRHSDTAVALATNQGGPSCRDAGWGDKYPSLNKVLSTYGRVAEELNAKLYMSLAYYTGNLYIDFTIDYLTRNHTVRPRKSGRWIYPKGVPIDDQRLQHDWRKPGSGMLIQAMKDVGAYTVVMVGDMFSDALSAATIPGCSFVYAREFFGWDTPISDNVIDVIP